MKRILVIGAGRSSSTLLIYLEKNSNKYGWEITVGDRDINLVKEKANSATRAITLDVFDEVQLDTEVQAADIVISIV
jgi:saccharopine dehydrogenase-like NADP-dependent oxidoreductase